MSESNTGAGEGTANGERLSCIAGEEGSAKGERAPWSNGGLEFVTITSTSFSCRSGDSSVELGGSSRTGVVQINKEAGTVSGMMGVEESSEAAGPELSSLVGERERWFLSSWIPSVNGLTESRTSGGSYASANSGSVMPGALCKGLEDKRCSFLAGVMAFTSRVVTVGGDGEETVRPLGP